MGLFKDLCQEFEPIAVEIYIQAPRNVRSSMLKLALKIYAHRFIDDEIAKILDAMKRLEALAEVRNQIAHGHCSNYSVHEDNVQVASGHYLLPSLNEGEFHERSLRFHHVPATIDAFREEVRDLRWQIIQASRGLRIRSQDNRTPFDGMIDQAVRRIARREVIGKDALEELRKLFGQIDFFERTVPPTAAE